MVQEDELVGLERGARIAGCHSDTLRRKILSGELPAIKLFGRWRIRREDLHRLLYPTTGLSESAEASPAAARAR